MIGKIARASEERPYAVILCVLLITGVAVYGVTKVSMTTEFREFLPQDYPSVKVTLEVENDVGGTTYEYVLIKADNVVKADIIRSIAELENTLRENQKLQAYILYVQSFTDYIENLESLPDTQLEMSVQGILSQSEAASGFVSENRDVALIKILVNPELSQSVLSEKTGVLHDLVDEFDEAHGDLTSTVTGDLSMSRDLMGVVNRDNRILIPAAIILIFVILFLVFRRLSDMLLPFLVLGVGAVWVTGALGYLGVKFTMVHVALIPLLLGIGIDYVIHMLNRYYEETSAGASAGRAAVTSVRTVGVAVFLAAATTMVGFGSFLITDLPPVRSLGVFAALGILFIFILATTLLPAVLVLRDRNRRRKDSKKRRRWGGGKIGKLLSGIALGAEEHRKSILLVTAVVTAACAVSALGISTTMSFETFMPEDVDSVAAMNEMNDYFGGQSTAFVLAKGDVAWPLNVYSMYNLENSVLSDQQNSQGELITGSYSIASLLWDEFQENISLENLPDLENLRVQIAEAIENLREQYPAQINRLVVGENEAIIYFYVRGETDEDMEKATEIIRSHVEVYSSSSLDMMVDGEPAVGGEPAIMTDIMGKIMSGTIRMTVVALILCIIILALIFRSPFIGVIAALPVVLALLWEFGVLRGLGWSLDVLTMAVSALVIGIGIDFAVHISHRFREERKVHGRAPKESIRRTVTSVGRALIAAAATTCGVFLILSLSAMPALTRFGTLSALVIFFALMAALVVLPSVLLVYATRRWKKKKR
jgi:hydrophobe/amphiphile efflux-3 (HAE3) family protein